MTIKTAVFKLEMSVLGLYYSEVITYKQEVTGSLDLILDLFIFDELELLGPELFIKPARFFESPRLQSLYVLINSGLRFLENLHWI